MAQKNINNTVHDWGTVYIFRGEMISNKKIHAGVQMGITDIDYKNKMSLKVITSKHISLWGHNSVHRYWEYKINFIYKEYWRKRAPELKKMEFWTGYKENAQLWD